MLISVIYLPFYYFQLSALIGNDIGHITFFSGNRRLLILIRRTKFQLYPAQLFFAAKRCFGITAAGSVTGEVLQWAVNNLES